MRLSKAAYKVGAVVVVIGLAGVLAEAGQRDSRGRDRNGRESQGRVRERDGGGGGSERGRPEAQTQAAPQNDAGRSADAQPQAGRRDDGQGRGGRPDNRELGRAVPRPDRDSSPPPSARGRDDRGRDDRGRDDRRDVRRGDRNYDYRNYGYRDDRYRYNGFRYYGPPRLIPAPRVPRRYYGPGGNFSVHFGWGSGYLFGSPYYGRVYGYSEPRLYGSRIYYGDVRLQVRPRHAAVYVDGYYAGEVDDFDGVFQRLTLEVGPHEIELSAPGFEPQFFEVYVDPARTVNIRADLFR
jgi:hypothetical protein